MDLTYSEIARRIGVSYVTARAVVLRGDHTCAETAARYRAAALGESGQIARRCRAVKARTTAPQLAEIVGIPPEEVRRYLRLGHAPAPVARRIRETATTLVGPACDAARALIDTPERPLNIAAVARAIGVSRQRAHQWAKRGWVPEEHREAWERLTGAASGAM